jgi:hypothetical protein
VRVGGGKTEGGKEGWGWGGRGRGRGKGGRRREVRGKEGGEREGGRKIEGGRWEGRKEGGGWGGKEGRREGGVIAHTVCDLDQQFYSIQTSHTMSILSNYPRKTFCWTRTQTSS